MKSRIMLCIILLLCMAFSYSAAENSYQILCKQHKIDGADVIAWLEIPGASICEPIMMHAQDDGYYSTHGPDGKKNGFGSAYVQKKYNPSGFSDPLTMVYGSSAVVNAPFRNLQETYSGQYEQCREVYIHLPEETREYSVFAALPHSSIHVLHYYDFNIERRFNSFFDSVFSTRALGMHLDEENRPQFAEDQVVVLSTALRGDNLQRYLVMAREIK